LLQIFNNFSGVKIVSISITIFMKLGIKGFGQDFDK